MSDTSRPRGPTVLVVDDHRFSRKYTAAALRETTRRVKQASTAAKALELALRDLPDLILTDLDLSGQSGLELVRRIQEAWPEGAPRPRFVVVSAERPTRGQCRAAGPGVEQFLVKPVGPEQLRALVARQKATACTPEEPLDRDAELRLLFRQELRSRLDDMDRLVGIGDFAGTGAILHQLIASSTLCGERELAARMRATLSACRRKNPSSIAASYYATWVRARHCLEREGA